MAKVMVLVPVIVAIAACDGGSGQVTVHTGSTLVTAIDPRGDDAWIRLPPMSDVTIDVGPRWRDASICGSNERVEVWIETHHRDDSDDVELPCRARDDAGAFVTVPITVTGTTKLAEVSFGPGGTVVDNGSGSLLTRTGTWDVFANELSLGTWTAADRIVIERGIAADPATPIAIDFLRDSFVLENRPVTAHGAIGPVGGRGQIELSGEHGTWALMPWRVDPPPATIGFPPANRLVADDILWADLGASDQTGASQDIFMKVDSDPIEVTFEAPLTDPSVTLQDGRPAATWKAVDGFTWAQVHAYWRDLSNRTVQWGYSDLDAADDDHLEFPDVTRIPGWDPAWALPATGDLSLSVSLSRRTDDGDGWVSASWQARLPQP